MFVERIREDTQNSGGVTYKICHEKLPYKHLHVTPLEFMIVWVNILL